MRRIVTASTLVSAVVAVGCSSVEGRPSATVRDSAGVTIVENPAPGSGRSPLWVVRRMPEVDIGVLDGEEPYQLFQVQNAVRLSDGRIVVANGGTRELRFFDADGTFLRAVGREGEGPGEFQQLGAVHPIHGDSLMVWDWRLRRVSVFDSEGVFGRSFSIALDGTRFPLPLAPFVDGSWVMRSVPLLPRDVGGGLRRDSITLYRVSDVGEVLDTLGTFQGREMWLQEIHRSGRAFVISHTLPFGRGSRQAVADTAVYSGATDRYELRRYDTSGRLRRIVRRTHMPIPVTPDDIALVVERRLAGVQDDNVRRGMEQEFEEMRMPDTMPVFDAMQVDEMGNLWVEDYRRPGDAQPRWSVFDPGGRLLGVVETPVGLEIHQIGEDFIVGTWEDEFEVQHVRVHALVKPTGDR